MKEDRLAGDPWVACQETVQGSIREGHASMELAGELPGLEMALAGPRWQGRRTDSFNHHWDVGQACQEDIASTFLSLVAHCG